MSGPRNARCTVLLLIAGVAFAWACTDVTVSPSTAFSLEVDTVPAPSVVAGDTMRDSLGNTLKVTAVAYNSHGAALANVPFQYVSFDTTQLLFDKVGHPIGTRAGDGAPNFVISVGDLESLPQALPVVLPPDSVLYADSDSTSIALSLLSGASNISPGLDVVLKHNPDTLLADSITRSYWVGYHVVYPAFATTATGAITDTSLALYLVNSTQLPAMLDTSDANGNTSQYLFFNAAKLAAIDPKDSVIVNAIVWYKGQMVAGSPLRFKVVYSE
jgi:hypothetical protein